MIFMPALVIFLVGFYFLLKKASIEHGEMDLSLSTLV